MKIRTVKPGQRYRKPPNSAKDIDVALGTFEYGEGAFSTIAASSCLVLAAHNSDTSQGLLGHFDSFTGGREGVSSAARYDNALFALQDLGPKDKTEIWLGGVTPIRLGELALAEENRQYALDRLGLYLEHIESPETPLTVGWNPEGIYISARLACHAGSLVIRQVYDLP